MWYKVRIVIYSLSSIISTITFIKSLPRGVYFDSICYGLMTILWTVTLLLLIKQKKREKN